MKTKKWISHVPVYEPGKPLEEVARELGFSDVAELIKVASNENELGPSPKAIAAMASVAQEMHRYPDGGSFYLKKRLADHLGVNPGNLILGNGSNELIEFLGHVFLEPGAHWVMSEYAFVVYRLVAALFHAEVLAVPMKNFRHDLDAMLSAITPETRMVVVCNPNNPTGTLKPPQEMEPFLNALPDHVLAVIDEAYFEFVPDALQSDVLKRIRDGQKNIIVLRTFSKAYGLAGLRIGYGIANEELISTLQHVRQPFNINAMAQAAARAALEDDEHIEKTRQMVSQGLAFFAEKLPTLGKDGVEFVPSCANFILVKTGNSCRVFEELQKRKIIIRPMNGYALPDWIRITIGTPPQNERVFEALNELLTNR